MTSEIKLWNIKHQSRLKVLYKSCYSKRDISATLVEAVFKLIKVQRKTVTHLIQNDVKFQWSVFLFLNRGFHAFVLTKFPLSLFNTLSCPYLTTAISISNDSLTFLSYYLFFMERVLGCNQSKCPWHSFACSVAPEDDQLLLMLSCWCSTDLLIISFLDFTCKCRCLVSGRYYRFSDLFFYYPNVTFRIWNTKPLQKYWL